MSVRQLLLWLRPVAFFALVLATAVTVVVGLVVASPGSALDLVPEGQDLDPAYCVGEPWHVQTVCRLASIATLDFGTSLTYRNGAEVSTIIWPALRTSLSITFAALALSFLLAAFAVALGVRGRRQDLAVASTMSFVSTIPAFLIAMLVQLFAGQWLGLSVSWRHYLVAIIILAVADGSLLDLIRSLRAELRWAQGLDHVQSAQANGDAPKRQLVITMFAPVAELVTSRLTLLLGTVLLVEIPLGMEGIGEVLYKAASSRDQNVVAACLVVLAAVICFANLLRIYAQLALDPRQRQRDREA